MSHVIAVNKQLKSSKVHCNNIPMYPYCFKCKNGLISAAYALEIFVKIARSSFACG